ncbi:MAG: hypothetical protein HY922_01890 [Elusimicrobia bacterium]|nr:hypothetical protein [Elusimicrobiota bacterium]
MRMFGAVAVLAAALWAVPCRGAGKEIGLKPLFWLAYSDSRTSLLASNLLLAAGQARLKRLEWTFKSLDLEVARRRAREAYEKVSGAILEFRPLAEAASLANGPSASDERRLRDSPEVRRKASAIPPSVPGQIDEILSLRGGYDPSQGRKALQRARALAEELEKRPGLGRPEMLASQAQALRIGKAAAAGLCAAAKALSPRAKPKAQADLDGLRSDCEALPVELERLEIYYRLNDTYAKNPTLF